VAEINRYQKF